MSHLCVDQRVVEQDEPVDGEATGVLQRQRLVAALADEPAVRLPQRVLTRQRHHSAAGDETPCDASRTLARPTYRHLAGEALPEVVGVFGVLPLPLQLQGQSLEPGAAVLQPLVLAGRLTTHQNYQQSALIMNVEQS